MGKITKTNKSFAAGDLLMKEGDRGQSAYIIESGEVEILVDRGTNKLRIGTRGPGAMVGEMAMIDDQPLVWNAVQMVKSGQRISIGAPNCGVYGYLHVGGGFAPLRMQGLFQNM